MVVRRPASGVRLTGSKRRFARPDRRTRLEEDTIELTGDKQRLGRVTEVKIAQGSRSKGIGEIERTSVRIWKL